jgi:hypothetical protein
METEYCGEAVAAGLGMKTALEGKSPVEGFGFAKADEEEWFPVALRMGREDLETMRELHEKAFSSETADGTVQQRIDKTFGHLEKVVRLVGMSENHSDEALAFLESLLWTRLPGREGSPADRLGPPPLGFWRHWIQQSDLETEAGVERCLAAARKYAGQYGMGSAGNFAFCANWLENGAKRCKPETGYAAAARHVLASMEHFAEHRECYILDRDAIDGGLAGWAGSLQRRQMAERFKDLTPPKVPRWNEETQQEELAVYAEMWPFILSRRAAAELAADEKDLTDLREVYGAWTTDGDATDSSPWTEP